MSQEIKGKWSPANSEQENARLAVTRKIDFERLSDIKSALQQYEDGAITFTEFYFYIGSKLTQEDLNEYNKLTGETYKL